MSEIITDLVNAWQYASNWEQVGLAVLAFVGLGAGIWLFVWWNTGESK